MSPKLTLELDEDVFEAAKEYSAKVGKPISRIVSEFFRVAKNARNDEENAVTPTVASLRGVLKGKGVGEDDYKKHLEQKHS